MAANQRDPESQGETTQPLLQSSQSKMSLLEKAVSQGAKGAAVLAKHLPLGSCIVFEALAPISTARGDCKLSSRIETIILISVCALVFVFLTITDSFKDDEGKTRYGIATFKGLFVLDFSSPPSNQEKYKLKLQDLIQAFTTLVLFAAFVLYNGDVESCFFGDISDVELVVQAFTATPLLIGIFGSILVLWNPSQRHGLGFPLGGLSSLQ